MSARPISSATVSFGLVSVPIKLYSSGESSARISFNWLSKSGTRVKQQYINPEDGKVVPRDEMVKGYEFAKAQYVTFSPEELKALEAQSTGSIDITEFVPAEQIERTYVDKVYYLGPDKGGDRAYRLLSAALREANRVAIGKYAARGKQYLVMIRPLKDGLAMEQLYYADEVRSFDEVPIGEGEVKPEELKLALQLIDQAASDAFNPESYRDEVRDRVTELISKKVEGEEITVSAAEEPKTQIIDLMEALKASLASGSGEIQAARTVKVVSNKKASATKRKKAAS